MADDTTVSEPDIEDVSLLTTDIAPRGSAASSTPAEEGKDDAAATTTPPAEEPKPDAKTTEATAPAKTAEDPAKSEPKPGEEQQPEEGKPAEGEEPQQPTPEETRAEQRARAQQEWQNRQRTRDNVATTLDQNFGPKTEEQLVEEGLDPQDAKIEAVRSEFAYNQERTRIAELNAGMQAEAVNAMRDFPVFDPNSKEFDPDFTAKVEQQYKIAARIQVSEVGKDQSGRPIEVVTNAEVPLYDFYQQMADIYGQGTSRGNQQGQAEMQQMLSRTENPGGSSSTNAPASGSLEEMEERLGNVVIT